MLRQSKETDERKGNKQINLNRNAEQKLEITQLPPCE